MNYARISKYDLDGMDTDVKDQDWYGDFIKTAAQYKIISGYENGKFGPMDKITREQAMAMIARAMNITGLKAERAKGEADKLLKSFTDASISAAKIHIVVGNLVN